MATQLFLRRNNTGATSGAHLGTDNTTILGAAVAWVSHPLSTSRGSSGAIGSVLTPTVAGATDGVDLNYNNTGPQVYEWLSLPLAADVTISGTVTLNIWAAESNMSANVAINVLIERISPTGAIASQILKTTRTSELSISTVNTSLNNFTATPTSTAMTKGDRIRVRLFGDDSTANMASGHTFWVQYDVNVAADQGDSWVQFNENLSFITEPAGSTLHLTDVAGPAVGADVEKEMWTSFGDGTNTAVRNTATGWTAPLQWTDTAGGTAIEWYSKPLVAFTLSGAVLVNLWAHVSNIAALTGIRSELAVCNEDGTGATVWSASSLIDSSAIGVKGTGTDDGGAVTTTSRQVRGYLVGPDVAVTDGQRLRLRVFIDDPCYSASVSGHTATLTYDHTTTGSGDSFITLGQTVTEFSSGQSAAANTTTETDTAEAVGKTKTRTVTAATTSDEAVALGRTKIRALSTATTTDTAGAVGHTFARAVGIATETDTSEPIGKTKTKSISTGAEDDTAGTLTATKAWVRAIGSGTPPTFVAASTTTSTNYTDPHSLNVPAGEIGDLLIASVVYQNNSGSPGAISGWTGLRASVIEAGITDDIAEVYARIATGSDAASWNPIGGGSTSLDMAAIVARFRNHGLTSAGSLAITTTASGTSATPDPGQLDLGQTEPVLWVEIFASDEDSGAATYQTTTPLPYTPIAQAQVIEVMTAMAYRAAGSHEQVENPGPMAMSASQIWRAWTIGIVGTRISETDTALPITPSKARAVGVATTTETAEPITVEEGGTEVPVNTAPEEDTAGAFGRVKARALGVASASDTAGDVSIVKSIGAAAETDTAETFGRVKTRALGVAAEDDTAGAVSGSQTRAIAAATESDTAIAITPTKTRTVTAADETDTAQAIGRVKARALSGATTTDTAGTVGKTKTKAIAAAAEADTADAITRTKTRVVTAALETDTAEAFGRAKTRAIGPAAESDTGHPVGQAGIMGTALETDTAEIIGRVKTRAINAAAESDSAGALGRLKARALAAALEDDTAIQLAKRLTADTATETDTAGTFGRVKTLFLNTVTEIDINGSVTRLSVTPIDSSSAMPIGRTKTKAIAAALEDDTAGAITAVLGVMLGVASETDTAGSFGRAKVKALGLAPETDAGQPVTGGRVIPVGIVVETDAASAISYFKARLLGIAVELDVAVSIVVTGGEPPVIIATVSVRLLVPEVDVDVLVPDVWTTLSLSPQVDAEVLFEP